MVKKILSISFILLLILTIFSGCTEEKNPTNNQKTETQIAIEFMNNLSNSKYQEAYNNFNATMKESLTLNQLKESWEYIINIYGNFENITAIKESEEPNYTIIYINSTFSNNYLLIFKIVFNENNKINGFWVNEFIPISEYNPPEYINTQNFTEEEIIIGNKWKLPATITIPNGEGPFPGVVLIHGSGPNDRDETIGPNKPFKDIAWGLASKNIVVLRYEKRTKEYSEEMSKLINFTVKEEVIDDALIAIQLLKNKNYVDQNKIFVIGHSLGGMLAPRIAKLDINITGIIILAGPTRGLEDLIINQTKYIANLDEIIDENEKNQIDYIQEQVKKIKQLNFSENELVLGAYRSYWMDLNNYNPIETAINLSSYILILQGDRDYQVTTYDFNNWLNSIGYRENVELILYPNLNHLFMNGSVESNPDEYQIEGHVEKKVINDISNWINNII